MAVEFSIECCRTAQEYTLTLAMQYPEGYSYDWLDDVLTLPVMYVRPLAGVAPLRHAVECSRAKVMSVES